MRKSDNIPTDVEDLDAHTVFDLNDVETGEEIWIQIGMSRQGRFRAARITIHEHVSVGGFEEFHAVDPWEEGNGTTIIGPGYNHQIAEGYTEDESG